MVWVVWKVERWTGGGLVVVAVVRSVRSVVGVVARVSSKGFGLCSLRLFTYYPFRSFFYPTIRQCDKGPQSPVDNSGNYNQAL